MKTLGEKILDLLEKNNMTQKELADAFGYTAPRINQWIKNKRDVNKNELIKLSKLFNVDVRYFLFDEIDDTPLLPLDGLTDEEIAAVSLIVEKLKESKNG